MPSQRYTATSAWASVATGPGVVILNFEDHPGSYSVHSSADGSAINAGFVAENDKPYSVTLDAGEYLHVRGRGGVVVDLATPAFVGSFSGVYGGTPDAITLTVGAGYAVIPARLQIRFRATATNTGAATVAVDGLPAVALRTVTGVALPAGYIRTDVDTVITFDGTYWVADRAAERGGTNDSGFERFANGTLRVWKNLTGLGPISTANGSLFNSSVITVGTLAADFLTGTVPSVGISGRGGSAACWAQGIADPVGGVGSTGGTFQLFRATSAAATTYKADCKYEGVWF